MRIRFAETAIAELNDIFLFVANTNSKAAVRLISQIREMIVRLSRFPELGRPKYRPDVRMFPVPHAPFLIFYTVQGDELFILSIRHAKRQPKG